MGAPVGEGSCRESTPGKPACRNYTNKLKTIQGSIGQRRGLTLFPGELQRRRCRSGEGEDQALPLTSWLRCPRCPRSSPVCTRICRWSPRRGGPGGSVAGATWRWGSRGEHRTPACSRLRGETTARPPGRSAMGSVLTPGKTGTGSSEHRAETRPRQNEPRAASLPAFSERTLFLPEQLL